MSHSAPVGEERLPEVLVENASDVIAEADDQFLGGRNRSSLDETQARLSYSDLTTLGLPIFPG
jgi:hypothetical protein